MRWHMLPISREKILVGQCTIRPIPGHVSTCSSLDVLSTRCAFLLRMVRHTAHGRHCARLTPCLPFVPSSTGPRSITPLELYSSLHRKQKRYRRKSKNLAKCKITSPGAKEDKELFTTMNGTQGTWRWVSLPSYPEDNYQWLTTIARFHSHLKFSRGI